VQQQKYRHKKELEDLLILSQIDGTKPINRKSERDKKNYHVFHETSNSKDANNNLESYLPIGKILNALQRRGWIFFFGHGG